MSKTPKTDKAMETDQQFLRKQSLIDAATMLIVGAASILLLIYVAFGEAKRTYDQFETQKMDGEIALIRDTVEQRLRTGLALREFAGFQTIFDNVMQADRSLAGISVADQSGAVIFSSGDAGETRPEVVPGANADGLRTQHTRDRILVSATLRNRFEDVGALTVNMRRGKLEDRIREAFSPCLLVGLLASLGFALYTYLASRSNVGVNYKRATFVYVGLYLTVSASVIAVLISLYAQGAEERARASAQTLAGRLDDIALFNLDFNQFDGIEAALTNFRKLNSDVNSISLVIDGRVAFDPDAARVGKLWAPDIAMQAISLPLSADGAAHPSKLIVEIPTSLVLWEVARSAKNFIALFIASSFLAVLFMELGRTLRETAQRRRHHDSAPDEESQSLTTILIKPAYFLAVFVDSLSAPFLPQFAQKLALAQGVSAGYASTPFMAYYACFALALIPAERLERRFGPRLLMIAGLSLCLMSYVVLAVEPTFSALVGARALSGVGQGVTFIGVQSYVLNHVRYSRRTQAAGVIVFGFQAGAMAGMAIGSLLVNEIGVTGVWALAASVASLTCGYLAVAVPDLRSVQPKPLLARTLSVWQELRAIVADLQFMRSMALIGVPAKAVMTGVVMFATPILLNQSGFAQEEVGQMTMIYAAAVVLTSAMASKFVDRTGSVESVLFAGAVCSGLGLLVLGAAGLTLTDSANSSNIAATLAMIAGLALVGAAHGLINAPVITNVANAPIATRIGASSVAAAYRLLERIGHVAGPVLLSQIFLFGSQSWMAICWVGVGALALGVLFVVSSRPSSQSGYHAEALK